ncbi:hypothetical protein BC829DRAFT_443421 [Chytridium lagenaria]|nr:hypothetical protein BC829DRAFT_443421 [Chytridium lagenaria]
MAKETRWKREAPNKYPKDPKKYKTTAVASQGVEADLLNVVKETAIRAENYILADQTRQKMLALQLQLVKMEHQLNADIIVNAITAWQNGLAESISTQLQNLSGYRCRRSKLSFKGKFHSEFLDLIKIVPNNYYDSLIRSLLLVVPHEVPDIPKSPYGWDIFSKKVTNLSKQPVEVIDVVARLLLHPLGLYKEPGVDIENKLFEEVMVRWSIIIGDLAIVDRGTIMRQVASILDANKKIPSEEIITILSATPYKPLRKEQEERGPSSVIQALERLVQPLDYTSASSNQPWEIGMHNEFARKWASSEDLRPAALRLCIVIALNTRIEFFEQCIDIIIGELFSKAKLKPYVYDCVLQILRGRYYVDTKINAREKIVGDLSLSSSYGYLTRPYAEENFDVITDRMRYFADLLFVKRKGPIPPEYLDTCVDVLVQMAAHNLPVTLKLISFLLEPRGSDSASVEIPASAQNAANRHDPQFGQLLNNAPVEFEAKVLNIYTYCDQIANTTVLGNTFSVYEPTAFSSKVSGNSNATKLRRAHTVNNATLQRSQNGDAIDKASLKSPTSPAIMADGRAGGSPGVSGMGASRFFDAPGDVTDNARASSEMPRNALDVVAEDGSIYNIGASLSQPSGFKGAKGDAKGFLVRDAVAGWYRACGDAEKNVDKLRFSSSLSDSGRPPPRNDKGDFNIVLRLLKEILRIVPLVPCADLVGGPMFIGIYLAHSMPDVATEASFSLQRLFQLYPDLRLSILNAFVNLIKFTPHDSDIFYCTVLLQLGFLVQTWANEDESIGRNNALFDRDRVQRVSCKIDAAMLVMLARPNPRVRLACLKILSDLYSITESLAPHANGPGFLPLYAILRDLYGQAMVPKVTAGLTLLSIAEVASSDFGILFRFYLGELTRQFTISGRPKALRHCAKILRRLALPLMTSVNTVDAAFVATYSSFCVLMMSLGAVPDKSEDIYTLEPQIGGERLMFNHFKDFLGPILNSDNDWEINAIISSTYFLHHGVVQLFVVQLWKWYTEISETPQRLNPMMLDNIIHCLRVITQCPDFESVIREAPAFQSSTVDIISEFLRMIEDPFLTPPSFNLALSLRLSDSIFSGRLTVMKEREAAAGAAESKNGIRPSMFFDPDATGLFWDNGSRRSVFLMLREWSLAIDIQANNPAPIPANFAIDEEKIAGYRLRFSACIGLATEALLSLGDMNEGVPLPAETLTWMANLEAQGYKVFTPQLLVNYENVLGTALAHSYGGKGVPHAFTNAIFEQEKVLEMSRLAADLFPSDAPSFLWEAVRCSRSVQKADKSPCLLPSQLWILELIVPWCRYVNLSNTDEDVVFAEFFRYLMDSAFYKPKHDEQVQVCWAEPAEQAVGLLSRLFGVFPEAVSEALAYHLSSAAFAWKANGDMNYRSGRPIVKTILLLSELLLHNYVAVAPHFPVLLNYILIHLPARLQDNSLSTFLISNVVEGYTGTLHRTGNMENPEYAPTIERLRKLLTYLETNICFVDWDSDSALTPESQRYLRIPISEFLSLLLSVFEKDYVSLSLDMARETMSWAADGLLGPEHSVRAIELYGLLLKLHPEIPLELINPLTSRLLDHVSILSVMESDLLASNTSRNMKVLWSQSSDTQQLAIRKRCENVISSVLRLHSTLMSIFATSGSLIQHPELLWSSVGVLHVPCPVFPKIWGAALDNCRFFLSSQARDEIKANEYFLFEPYDNLQRRPPSLQPILLQGIVSQDRSIQEKSFDFLLQSWLVMPEYIVDASPTGLLYTILYTLMWVFVNILEDQDPLDREAISVDAIALHLQEILTLKSPLEFAGMIRCLQTISNGEPLPTMAVDDLLEKSTANVAQVYFPEYINNIADFCGFAIRLSPAFGRVVLKMTQVFWSLANHGQKPVGNFKSLVRRLPFIVENREVVNPLIGFVLRETADSDDFIKEIDLTSAGKVEVAPEGYLDSSANDAAARHH